MKSGSDAKGEVRMTPKSDKSVEWGGDGGVGGVGCEREVKRGSVGE